MKIAVLNYSTVEVDIINVNIPDDDYDAVEEWLSEHYHLSEIHWMAADHLSVNRLTMDYVPAETYDE
jgi:hypothetical protein